MVPTTAMAIALKTSSRSALNLTVYTAHQRSVTVVGIMGLPHMQPLLPELMSAEISKELRQCIKRLL